MRAKVNQLLLCLLLVVSCVNPNYTSDGLPQDKVNGEPIEFVCHNNTCLLTLDVSIIGENSKVALETGCQGLILDIDFASRIFDIDSLMNSCLCTKEKLFLPYESSTNIADRIFTPIGIEFSGEQFMFDYFFLLDLKTDFGVDAFLPFPKDSKLKWNFDFSNGQISLVNHINTEEFDFQRPIHWEQNYIIVDDFPIVQSQSGNDVKSDCILDTGTDIYSIAIFNSLPVLPDVLHEDQKIFSQNSEISFYRIEQNDIHSNPLYIYWDNSSDIFDKPIIGMDLLIRYDVCIDFELMSAFFKENFTTSSSQYFQGHGAEITKLTVLPNDNYDSAIVMMIGDSCPAYSAGVRPFDVIKKVGGEQFSNASINYQQYCRDNNLNCLFSLQRGEEEIEITFKP